MFLGRLLTWFIALLTICSPVSVAFAEDTSGRFVFIEMGTRDYSSMEHAGATVTVGTVRGAASVVESGGGPFAAGDIYSATCFVYLTNSDAGIELEAPCTFTDTSGDSWYVLAVRRAGDTSSGGGGSGIQSILGGTGKYAGLTGACPYTSSYLPNDAIVSHAVCEWRKP